MAGRGLNKVMLIGHLGADPETKVLPSGQTVANFSIATSESYKDQSGNLVEKTEWHKIVVYGKLAEICKQYLKKGKQVYLEGKIQTRSWDDKTTNKKAYMTEIICNEMQMIGAREGGGMSNGDGENNGANGSDDHDASAYQDSAKSAPAPKMKTVAVDAAPAKDDLPF
jgi:single-strand DNA-binding protein